MSFASRLGLVLVLVVVTACDESSPTAPRPRSTPTVTATPSPTPTQTPIPCPNLAGWYDLYPGTAPCSPSPIPIPFGTLVLQEGCSIRFALRVGSGYVSGEIHGDTIAVTWSDGCDPPLFGTGTFELQPDGRYKISGAVTRQPNFSCCTNIQFFLNPRVGF